jgi:hypothetical protein
MSYIIWILLLLIYYKININYINKILKLIIDEFYIYLILKRIYNYININIIYIYY